MSIPSTIDTQLVVSKYGTEKSAYSIVLAGTLWVIHLRNGVVFLREYQGARTDSDIILSNASYITVSNSLTGSYVVSTTSFILWYIVSGTLYARVLTPSTSSVPNIGTETMIKAQATAAYVSVANNKLITCIIVDQVGQTAVVNSYQSFPTLTSSNTLPWSFTRNPVFSSYTVFNTLRQLKVAFTQVGSPENVYLDELEEIVIPDPPTLVSPANGTTGLALDLTLIWNPSTYADTYRVQLSTSITFSSTVLDQAGLVSTSEATPHLGNGSHYYWRVSATNVAGTSDWSSTFSFITIFSDVPTASIIANPPAIMKYEVTDLIWETQFGNISVSIDQGIGEVAASGTLPVSPHQTTTYTITVVGEGGVAYSSVTVTVYVGILKVSKNSTLKADEFRVYEGNTDMQEYSEFVRALLTS